MKRFLFALLAAAVLTAVAASNLLYTADNAVSDRLYQESGPDNRDIVLFGIDQETVAALGPVTNLRGAMAQVIETLNADPENRPAVIGIDLMFTGENRDAPEADERLAAAAAKGGNVVVAADAKLGRAYTAAENGAFTVGEQAVLSWYEPYEGLSGAAACGHVNAAMDRDGFFRHARLYLDTPENGRVCSFARVIYERWCEEKGLSPAALPETSERGFYYLPFSRGIDENGLLGYSEGDGMDFLSLYRGEVDPYFYRGKIVLIGVVYPGSGDEVFTSFDHAVKLPGVLVQANIVEAFQRGFFPQEAPRSVQLFALFVFCFLLAAFLWERKVLPSLIAAPAFCACWLAACRAAYGRGLVLHALWGPFGAVALLAVSVALNYMVARREQRRIRDTFGYYIDPVIRDQLLAQGTQALQLGGTARNIAVLFVDVRGFTTMSEALDAETVVGILNRYLTLTTACIVNHHGTLDKFVGDCTMAIWNAPLEQEEPVYLACRAAMDMLAGAEPLNRELEERYGRGVSFGIGVNWGPAVVGNIGAPKRLDYTAIGDTVNTAARLEANAPGGTILLSRAAAEQLGGRARVTSLGNSIPLKGKSADFEVLRLDELL